MGNSSWVTSPLNWSRTNAMIVTPSKEGTACTSLERTILATSFAPHAKRRAATLNQPMKPHNNLHACSKSPGRKSQWKPTVKALFDT
jgi:hypothetical protein